ncbi:hypothetical protein DFH09DRAFT_1284097 [Mycena vulgaris]|nr:hypothetical protein DFH09DRAFT_1284097 [Mycena vulgaris]
MGAVHECSFNSAFTSALILEGGIDEFAYEKRALFVFLRYRPDCQENPSVAFSVMGCAWMTDVEMDARFGKVNRTSALEVKVDSTLRAEHPGYRGLLRVYFKMKDHTIGEVYPQTRVQGPVGVLHRAHIATVDHTKWMSRIQQFVRDGLVMRAAGEAELLMQLGRLKMEKGKWVWVELTKTELMEFGYPSDFIGLLF